MLNTAASLQLLEMDHAIRSVNALHKRLDSIEASNKLNGHSVSIQNPLYNNHSKSATSPGIEAADRNPSPKPLDANDVGHFGVLAERSVKLTAVPTGGCSNTDGTADVDRPTFARSSRTNCAIQANICNNSINKRHKDSRSNNHNGKHIPDDLSEKYIAKLIEEASSYKIRASGHSRKLDKKSDQPTDCATNGIRNSSKFNGIHNSSLKIIKNDKNAESDGIADNSNLDENSKNLLPKKISEKLSTDQLFDEIFMINEKHGNLVKKEREKQKRFEFVENVLSDTEELCAKMLQDKGSTVDEGLHQELTRCQKEIRLLRDQLNEKSGPTKFSPGNRVKKMDHKFHNGLSPQEIFDEPPYKANGTISINVGYIDSSSDSINNSDPSKLKNGRRLPTELNFLTHEVAMRKMNQSACSVQNDTQNKKTREKDVFSQNILNQCANFNGSKVEPDQAILSDSCKLPDYANFDMKNSYLEKSYEAKYQKMKILIAGVQTELQNAKETLLRLKEDKKKLKAEKQELLNQMKEVYGTLELKEIELREFIRQFEQKMRDSDKGIEDLITEKEKLVKDKQNLEENARNNDEVLKITKATVEREQLESARLKSQLKELQGRFALLTNHRVSLDEQFKTIRTHDLNSLSSTASFQPSTPRRSAGLNAETPVDQSNSSRRSADWSNDSTPLSNATATPPTNGSHGIRGDFSAPPTKLDLAQCQQRARSAEASRDPLLLVGGLDEDDDSWKLLLRRNRRQSTPQKRAGTARNIDPTGEDAKNTSNANNCNNKPENRLSKLFNNLRRTKSKEISGAGFLTFVDVDFGDPIAADLSLAEKAEKLAEARQTPLVRWRQAHVLAWLELELGMGQYSQQFTQNVKSGRVLMNLTNTEIEKSLKIGNQMHKKKLRLAIEQYRAPTLWKFPLIKDVSTHYLCSNFLPSLGLSMYVETFRSNLVDGRILNYANKDQLIKCLSIGKKFHQTSILKGVELLRMFDFDLKILNKRRLDCEKDNVDMLVWTNARMSKWLRQIDLEEFVNFMENSGLHGAVVVLDSNFSAEILANVLKIPGSKKMIRKHLADEFIILQQQARSRLRAEQAFKAKDFLLSRPAPKRSISLGKGFARSNTADADQGSFEGLANVKKRQGIRSSIVKAFGLRTRNEVLGTDSEFVFKYDRSGDDARAVGVPPLATNGESSADDRRRSSFHVCNHSSATLSSTTSDLGSSIERSQHLNTILAPASQVLAQAPMTSACRTTTKMGVAATEFISQRSSSNFNEKAVDVTPIKMRAKKSIDPLVIKRPYSMGDFSNQSTNRLSASSLVSYLLNKQMIGNNASTGTSTSTSNNHDSNLFNDQHPQANNLLLAKQRYHRLKNCASVDSLRFVLADKCPPSPTNQKRSQRSSPKLTDQSPSSDRRLRIIGPIAECGELEQCQLLQNQPPMKNRDDDSFVVGRPTVFRSDFAFHTVGGGGTDPDDSTVCLDATVSYIDSNGTVPVGITAVTSPKSSYVVRTGWRKRRTQSLMGLVGVASSSTNQQPAIGGAISNRDEEYRLDGVEGAPPVSRFTSKRLFFDHATGLKDAQSSNVHDVMVAMRRKGGQPRTSSVDRIHETDL